MICERPPGAKKAQNHCPKGRGSSEGHLWPKTLSSEGSWRNILMNLWRSGSHLSVVSQIFSVMKMLVVVVQLPSHVWLFATPWTTARQTSLFLTISQSLPSSCPLNQWCHSAISFSVTVFSFCLQSFSASGSFPVSWLFTSGASTSAPVLPVSIQGWCPLKWLV